MSKPSWRDLLSLKLQNLSLSRPDRLVRLAVVGMGSELHGDEAAGVIVARKLRSLESPQLRVVEAGLEFENVTRLLGQFHPGLILLITALQLSKLPGAIRWLDWRDAIGLSGSPSVVTPPEIAQRWADELGCEVALIGIQPYESSFGVPLSSDVRRAVDEVVQTLRAALMPATASSCSWRP